MKKKAYQAPELKVIKCQMENQLLAASNERYGVMSKSYSDDDYEFDEN